MLFPLKTDFPLAKNPHSYPKIQHHTDHPAVIPNSTPPYLERSVAESRDLMNIGSIPITQSLLSSRLPQPSSRTNVRDPMNIGNIPITKFSLFIIFRYFTYFAIFTYPAVLRGRAKDPSAWVLIALPLTPPLRYTPQAAPAEGKMKSLLRKLHNFDLT